MAGDLDLNALVARLEAAAEGGRELDGDIAAKLALHPEGAFRMLGIAHSARFGLGAYEHWESPRYTTSLDAALTLVQEGWDWMLLVRHGIYCGTVTSQRDTLNHFHGESATPALAMCIAALRARMNG